MSTERGFELNAELPHYEEADPYLTYSEEDEDFEFDLEDDDNYDRWVERHF